MSVTRQEAMFLKSILVKHLDDYVEELAKEEKEGEKMMKHMLENREAGKELLEKTSDVIRRSSRQSNDPYFSTK
tara:strand:- start:5001 stop:5222 length:222 start_codon:yes stop_codon:yes gene_type:complete